MKNERKAKNKNTRWGCRMFQQRQWWSHQQGQLYHLSIFWIFIVSSRKYMYAQPYVQALDPSRDLRSRPRPCTACSSRASTSSSRRTTAKSVGRGSSTGPTSVTPSSQFTCVTVTPWWRSLPRPALRSQAKGRRTTSCCASVAASSTTSPATDTAWSCAPRAGYYHNNIICKKTLTTRVKDLLNGFL